MQQEHLYLAGAYAAALLVTLILAAHLTPPGWWRRPNARALLILVGGTWALGSLLLAWLPLPLAAPPTPMRRTPALAPAPAPDTMVGAGLAYRAHHDLNLRAAAGIDSARIAVVPGGANVRATGVRDGDWWQVDAGAPGHPHIGWASSLWLRRIDEVAPAR